VNAVMRGIGVISSISRSAVYYKIGLVENSFVERREPALQANFLAVINNEMVCHYLTLNVVF
jgi:hypothetical protein